MELGHQIGVSSQQVRKYETGFNALSVGRLQCCARALKVDINYFFEGLDAAGFSVRASTTQRLLNELLHDFIMIPDRRHQAAVCSVTRALCRLN
jgi:transcriptional regulator with XRE-family HTH domain